MPEVVIPIGPQHPALKEPVNFRIIADGEKIVRLELNLSYNHRGIEKAAEQRNFIRVLPRRGGVGGMCSDCAAPWFALSLIKI
jgi:NADH-quinone oxidoreductase subunit D